MTNYCPNCGYNLKHLEAQVKRAPTEHFYDDTVGADGNLVVKEPQVDSKTVRENEASAAKQRLGVTPEQRRDIINLFNNGKSVYQIKNRLQLDIEPELIRRIGVGRA